MRTRRVGMAVAAITLSATAWAAPPAGKQPALGTVTGTLTLDGKPIAISHAIAVLRPDVFEDGKPGYTLAFTKAAMTAEPSPMASAGERLRHAVTAGFVLEVGQKQYCKIIVRDPSLGGAELQNMGGLICTPESITAFGPDRVAGMIKQNEEDVAGHKLAYSLQFNAPVAKGAPAKAK